MTHPANSDLLIHDLFLQQASQAPERPAVISSGRTLSYADLRVLSSSLGYRLRSIGVQPNALVAVVMEKGWEQIVAVMGTLIAGAAYLPIDANVPAERLHFLLENGEVQVVLTQSWLDEKITWPSQVTRWCVDVDGEGPREKS